MQRVKKLLTILIISLTISACASPAKKVEYVYVPIPLERPERPVFPNIKGTDLQCVRGDTIQSLKMRDEVMKSYMNRLEAIIDGTKIVTDQ